MWMYLLTKFCNLIWLLVCVFFLTLPFFISVLFPCPFPSASAFNVFFIQPYRVSMLHKLRTSTEVQLGKLFITEFVFSSTSQFRNVHFSDCKHLVLAHMCYLFILVIIIPVTSHKHYTITVLWSCVHFSNYKYLVLARMCYLYWWLSFHSHPTSITLLLFCDLSVHFSNYKYLVLARMYYLYWWLSFQ